MTKRWILSLPMLILLASAAFGQTVRTWVSTAGNDANPCSRSSPCRNFSAAIAAVDSGGEVVVLDAGGFGPATITKSVALIAPRGIHAAIAPTADQAILVNASGFVVLRNLYLKSRGAPIGVNFDAGLLALDHVTVEGFTGAGLDSRAQNAWITVTDCRFVFNSAGILLFSSSGLVNAVVHRSAFIDQFLAVEAHTNARLTVKDSQFHGYERGVRAGPEGNPTVSRVTLQGCTFTGRGVVDDVTQVAISADGNAPGSAVVAVSDCIVTATSRGAVALQNGQVLIHNSVFTRNFIGLENSGQAGAVIQTDGVSMVHGNLTNSVGTISNTPLQ